MPSARRAGVPPEILKEWEADFRQKKAEQKKAGTKRLPSGSVQYEYNGVTYTAKYVGKDRSVNFPEAAYEARVEGARSRKGEQQKIKLSSLEQKMVDQKYKDAQMLSKHLGQKIVVDHIIPIEKGGFSNDPNNLQLITETTNGRKSNSMEWYNAASEESKYLSSMANDLDGGVEVKGGSATIKASRFAKPAGLAAPPIQAKRKPTKPAKPSRKAVAFTGGSVSFSSATPGLVPTPGVGTRMGGGYEVQDPGGLMPFPVMLP